MAEKHSKPMIDITGEPNLWDHCFTVHSLVIIGSKEEDGRYNMAPKHMAMPLGFGPYFAFMGTPRKSTYRNIEREEAFTVSFPSPEQLVISSLTASQREKDDSKPVIDEIPTINAKHIDGKLLKDSYFQLECKLHKIMGNFGEWEIITGKIVGAYIHQDYVRKEGDDRNNARLIRKKPILAYLHPDRFGIIKDSNVFPFPKNFKR